MNKLMQKISNVESLIAETKEADKETTLSIINRAREMKGLSLEEIATLLSVKAPLLLNEIFKTAEYIKDTIYGNRLVIFAPLYISNLCANECTYCAFRAKNSSLKRKALSQQEIITDVEALIAQGHKRVLLVAGESYPKEGFEYVLKAVSSVYKAQKNSASIRRVNVNVAPLSLDEFKELKKVNIGTYQIFQETYHLDTYHKVHLSGKKRDYEYRLSALDRAMEAGIDDVGIGVLFGLHDYKFEILAMVEHIKHLEEKFGVGPHTISVPRLEPATGSDIAENPPYPVSDNDFKKIVAILRLAVPYTGIIMSTRETAKMRRETFALGVSQISAGSRTNPGGYSESENDKMDSSQFSLGDHRSLDEVIKDISKLGYIPSFCTGCYRLGRTGADFMDLAKPGDIKHHCGPNAVSTYQEYLLNYGTDETKKVGDTLIANTIDGMDEKTRVVAEKLRSSVLSGESDVYC